MSGGVGRTPPVGEDDCQFADCRGPLYDDRYCLGHSQQQLAGRFLSPLRPQGRTPTFDDALRSALSMLRHHAPATLALFAQPTVTDDVDQLVAAIRQIVTATGGPFAPAGLTVAPDGLEPSTSPA